MYCGRASHSQHSVYVLVKPSAPLVWHEKSSQQPDHTQQLATPNQDGRQKHVLPLPTRSLRTGLSTSSDLGRTRESRLSVQHPQHRPEHFRKDINDRAVRSRPRHPHRCHAPPDRRQNPKRLLRSPNSHRRAALSLRLRTACSASRILHAKLRRAAVPRAGPGRFLGRTPFRRPLLGAQERLQACLPGRDPYDDRTGRDAGVLRADVRIRRRLGHRYHLAVSLVCCESKG
jgi:hypothetical protein